MAARGAGGGEEAEWCGTEIRFGMMQAVYTALYVFNRHFYWLLSFLACRNELMLIMPVGNKISRSRHIDVCQVRIFYRLLSINLYTEQLHILSMCYLIRMAWRRASVDIWV